MKRTSIVLSLVLLCGAASAEESFFTYADVVDVEPLFETRRVPMPQRCRWERESAPELGERARSSLRGEDLGDLALAIDGQAAQARARYRDRACAHGGDIASERRVRAYRVTFRYRGELHEAETETRPGDRMRIRVRMAAVGDVRRLPARR